MRRNSRRKISRSQITLWAVLYIALWAGAGSAETLKEEGGREYFSYHIPASGPMEENFPRFSCKGCIEQESVVARRIARQPHSRAASNPSKERSGLKLNTDYFLGVLSDTKYILLSPLNWDTSDWVKASLVLGTTGAFFALDNDIRKFVQDNRSATTDDLANVFEPFGNGAYTFPGLVAFYLYGRFFENEKAERAALLSVESFAVTGLFTFALKFSTGRTRPGSANSSGEWSGPNFDDVSFPSGHTSSAFAIATVIASEYDEHTWVPPVAYGLAALTGLTRLNDNKHWASDVFFGGAMGYLVSKTILKLHSDKKGRHYTIYPRISKAETGLEFVYRF